MYIGLNGSFAYKKHRKNWIDREDNIPTRHLYINISNKLENEEDGRIYEFKFLEKKKTSGKDIYFEKSEKNSLWFKTSKILSIDNVAKLIEFFREQKFDDFACSTLAKLQQVVHIDKLINYFLEKEQSLDKTLNIFIRINSGGEPLNFSDLLMSIAVANWEEKDARKEIHNLVDTIKSLEFNISKDFILKTFLYLYSSDIKFRVTNFSKENAKNFEEEWDNIKDSILSAFELIKSYGFNDYNLTSKNSMLPIIYYLYHKQIYRYFKTKIEFKEQREAIKKWLHLVSFSKKNIWWTS